MKLSIEYIVNASLASVVVPPRNAETVLTTLDWDSRNVKPGSLFVAIVGEHANGNHYIVQAIQAGAGAVIASEAPTEEAMQTAQDNGTALLLAQDGDAIGALLALARAWRRELTGTVVGVTGSSGKTTTKDLIAAVTAQAYATHATCGNRNSEIGLAETILDASPQHEMIVCEMGMQGLGEIARLSEAAVPHIGVVTNIGVAHCELLGSRENIARAKAELLASLPDTTGVAIVPGDDPYTPALCTFAQLDQRSVSRITYGLGEQNDIRATHISYDAMGYPSFDIWTPDGRSYPVSLSLQGEHNILNALAAVAVGLRVGVSIASITRGLAEVKPAALRQEVLQTSEGDVILNDTYNANPDSMRAALSLLGRLASTGRRVAVLGDMYELGSEEIRYHRQIGEYAFVNGIDELITVGELGGEIAAGALAVGMPSARVHRCSEVSEAHEALMQLKRQQAAAGAAGAPGSNGAPEAAGAPAAPGTSAAPPLVILVKASRGMQLERLVESFTAEDTSLEHGVARAQEGAGATTTGEGSE